MTLDRLYDLYDRNPVAFAVLALLLSVGILVMLRLLICCFDPKKESK